MTDQTLDLDAIDARARAVLDARRAVRDKLGVGMASDGIAAMADSFGVADNERAELAERTREYQKFAADPSTTLALTAEVRKLREAAATALGNLDDPTGGEHVADMRAAAAVLREALKAPQS